MAERINIQCPGCSAKLGLSDASKLGKKIRCPKCSEVFVAQALKSAATKTAGAKPAKPAAKPAPAKKPAKKSDDDEFNFDDTEMEDKSDSEDEEQEAPVRSKAGGKKVAAKGKGKGKKKSGGLPLPLIIGGAVAVVLLLGVVGFFLFRGGKKEEPVAAPPAVPVAQPVAAAAPVAEPESPNDRILALKWLPQDTELIIHLKISDVWQAPLLQSLLASPQVAGSVQQMQQVTGLAPTDLESVTIGLRNMDQLQQAGAMMAFGAPPPMDSLGLIVVRSKKAVDIAQLQQTAQQSVPNQALKLAEHNGKQFLEMAMPDAPPRQGIGPPGFGPPNRAGAPPGFGAPPGAGPANGGFPGGPNAPATIPGAPAATAQSAGGGKSMGAWFANTNTLILGMREQLVAAIDRGETSTPRNEFRQVDASPHLLFVAAPKNLQKYLTPQGGPAAVQTPGEAEYQKVLQENLRAVSFGASVTGGVGLQSSLVCGDPSGAAKVKPELEKFIITAKSNFEASKASQPQFAVEFLEMLVNNIQVSEKGSSVQIATSIPDSAQQKLEQLPSMLMGAALMGGLGGGPIKPSRPANSAIIESPTKKGDLLPGLSEPIPTSDVAGLPAGCSLNARTSWKSQLLTAKGRRPDFPPQLVFEFHGDILKKTCGYGRFEFKTIQFDSGDNLKPIEMMLGNEPHLLVFIVPYIFDDKTADSSSVLQMIVPYEVPQKEATKIAVMEGSFVLRTFENTEEITIDDVRAIARNPDQPLKSSLLLYMSSSSRFENGVSTATENIKAIVLPGFTAGVIEVWDKDNPNLPPMPLTPQYANYTGTLPPGGECSDARICETQRSLPQRIAMRLQMRSKFNEVRVPFRFENVTLPKSDTRPKL